MMDRLLFYLFVLIGIWLIGYWMERLIATWYGNKQQTQECLLNNLLSTVKSLYAYLIEETENEPTK
jgi:hypothetical protein